MASKLFDIPGSDIYNKIFELCEMIDKAGMERPDGLKIIRFAKIFRMYTRISDTVVGLLIRARKYGLVDFDGEMLYQRQDDNKIITLLMPFSEIKTNMRPSGDPKCCVRFINKDDPEEAEVGEPGEYIEVHGIYRFVKKKQVNQTLEDEEKKAKKEAEKDEHKKKSEASTKDELEADGTGSKQSDKKVVETVEECTSVKRKKVTKTEDETTTTTETTTKKKVVKKKVVKKKKAGSPAVETKKAPVAADSKNVKDSENQSPPQAESKTVKKGKSNPDSKVEQEPKTTDSSVIGKDQKSDDAELKPIADADDHTVGDNAKVDDVVDNSTEDCCVEIAVAVATYDNSGEDKAVDDPADNLNSDVEEATFTEINVVIATTDKESDKPDEESPMSPVSDIPDSETPDRLSDEESANYTEINVIIASSGDEKDILSAPDSGYAENDEE